MTGRKRLARVVDLVLVSRADAPVEHDASESSTRGGGEGRHVGCAHGEEVRAEATDEPFQPYLKNGRLRPKGRRRVSVGGSSRWEKGGRERTVMSAESRPIVVAVRSWKLRLLIWKTAKKTKGMI